ncbi:hypothetical protein D1872_279060 [compost metagenome]
MPRLYRFVGQMARFNRFRRQVLTLNGTVPDLVFPHRACRQMMAVYGIGLQMVRTYRLGTECHRGYRSRLEMMRTDRARLQLFSADPRLRQQTVPLQFRR